MNNFQKFITYFGGPVGAAGLVVFAVNYGPINDYIREKTSPPSTIEVLEKSAERGAHKMRRSLVDITSDGILQDKEIMFLGADMAFLEHSYEKAKITFPAEFQNLVTAFRYGGKNEVTRVLSEQGYGRVSFESE